jgi:hypothetical protein
MTVTKCFRGYRKKFLGLVAFCTIAFGSCSNGQNTRMPTAVPAAKDEFEILTEREKAYTSKISSESSLPESTISFVLKTDNLVDFPDGRITSIRIDSPGKELPALIGRNETVVASTKAIIIIDYPLNNEYSFELYSKTGFTREQLIIAISEQYYKLYEEEELTARTKTVPIAKRTKMYNRNQTDGKYGIWGHDIGDLVLTDIGVYKKKDGAVVLRLNIES